MTVDELLREDGYLPTKALEALRGGKIEPRKAIVWADGKLWSRLDGGWWRPWA